MDTESKGHEKKVVGFVAVPVPERRKSFAKRGPPKLMRQFTLAGIDIAPARMLRRQATLLDLHNPFSIRKRRKSTLYMEPGEKVLFVLKTAWDYFRYLYSGILVAFALALSFKMIADQQTNIFTWGLDVPATFIILIFLQYFLSVLEGAQASIVGLFPVSKDTYSETHPMTFRITSKCHEGNNLDKFVVGRQFLVVFVVFIITAALTPNTALIEHNPFGVPDWFFNAFLSTGLFGALLTVVFGQLLTAAVIAPNMKIDFLNNVVCAAAAYLSLIVEWAGFMHFVYVFQAGFQWFGGKSGTNEGQAAKEEEKSVVEKAWWVIRVVFSALLLAFALAVTIHSLFAGASALNSVPPAASFVLFLFFLFFAALLEGLQIALFAAYEIPPKEYRVEYPRAYQNCTLLFGEEGKHLAAFMIGRQILVTLLVFFLSMVCTVNPQVTSDIGENVFGVADFVQSAFLETGLLGAVITTFLGSLMGRIVASTFPIAFCNAAGMSLLIYGVMGLEKIGLTHIAWPLALGLKWVLEKFRGWKPDSEYTTAYIALE